MTVASSPPSPSLPAKAAAPRAALDGGWRSAAPRFFQRHGDLLVAAWVLVGAAVMIVPLPTQVLDVLLAANLAGAVSLLVVSLEAGEALRIAALPTLLLVTTLFRAALAIAATRLVLGHANAGTVIAAFGRLVAGRNVVVGAVVFVVLTLVQFLVIAKGAERVAEVAARFTLDALPGKQLAIDAELRAGHIDRGEADRRRRALGRESQFFGAMDGAMKFVRGDAVAGLAILGVNIIGGLAVGILQRGMDPARALETYTILTIGEGLVAQIPALLTATAAGIVVTRVAAEDEPAPFGRELGRQLARHPRALALAAGLLGLLALAPGLPLAPLGLLAVGLGWAAWRLHGARPQGSSLAAATPPSSRPHEAMTAEPAGPLSLRVGASLRIALDADVPLGGGLREALGLARADLVESLGLVWPATALEDLATTHRSATPDPAPWAFMLRLHGTPLAAGEILQPPAAALATPLAPGPATRALALSLRDAAHRHAAELLGVEETHRLLAACEASHPSLVREVVPKLVSVVALNAVLRRLLDEKVSLRPFPEILAALAAAPERERHPAALALRARQALKRELTFQHLNAQGHIEAVLLDPLLEDTLREALRESDDGPQLALEPELASDIREAVERSLAEARRAGAHLAVVLTSSPLRPHLRHLLRNLAPLPPVLAFEELLPHTPIFPFANARVAD